MFGCAAETKDCFTRRLLQSFCLQKASPVFTNQFADEIRRYDGGDGHLVLGSWGSLTYEPKLRPVADRTEPSPSTVKTADDTKENFPSSWSLIPKRKICLSWCLSFVCVTISPAMVRVLERSLWSDTKANCLLTRNKGISKRKYVWKELYELRGIHNTISPPRHRYLQLPTHTPRQIDI